jgi:riboflavin biosynthesis pyrimidine reductase
MDIHEVTYDSKEIGLKCIFDNTEKLGYKNNGLECKKVEDIYGRLKFGEVPENRPITYASYVMSVDGKIAFEDDEVGPLIAKNNYLDPPGAVADFWVLSMLRGNCDGIVIGSGTLIKEPTFSGCVYDTDLVDARVKEGRAVAPWTVIVTRTGKNIPYKNPLFIKHEVPILIVTSPNGFEELKLEIPKEYYLVSTIKNEIDKGKIKESIAVNRDKIGILVTGSGDETNPEEMLEVLRAIGMEKVLIESPTYCHYLMKNGMLDEIFINTSGVFVGGKATSIGSQSKSFTSQEHPHSEIVSIHIHSPHFIYTRYKLLYDVKPSK